jgi:RecG-like helicase
MEKLSAIREAKSGFEISKIDLDKRGFGILQSDLQSGFKSFIFARYWEKKWRPVAIDEDIISQAKSIEEVGEDLGSLFLISPDERLKI